LPFHVRLLARRTHPRITYGCLRTDLAGERINVEQALSGGIPYRLDDPLVCVLAQRPDGQPKKFSGLA
jgi:hypothetical protein